MSDLPRPDATEQRPGGVRQAQSPTWLAAGSRRIKTVSEQKSVQSPMKYCLCPPCLLVCFLQLNMYEDVYMNICQSNRFFFESLHVLNTSWGFNLTTRHSTAQVATGFDFKFLFWYPFPTQDSSCFAFATWYVLRFVYFLNNVHNQLLRLGIIIVNLYNWCNQFTQSNQFHQLVSWSPEVGKPGFPMTPIALRALEWWTRSSVKF